MNKQYKGSIDFLLWSYFNLTLADGEDADGILDMCIQKAYKDATQQGAYNTQIPKEDVELKEKSAAAKSNGEKKIIGGIKQLQNGVESFTIWHDELCNELKKLHQGICIEEEPLFSYGNAQKWVNMTLKYLYLLYPIYEECCPACEFCKTYKMLVTKYASQFQVPVDRYIIKAVWDTDDVKLPTEKRGTKYSGDKVKPWSKWKYDEYIQFQNSLRDCNELLKDKSPIEWEGPTWIKMAQEENDKKH